MAEVVMTSGLEERRSSDSWWRWSPQRLLAARSFLTAHTWPLLGAAFGAPGVGQRKHGLRSRQVLGQTAISHFGKTPQLLDYAKGVFTTSPGPRACPVDHPPALAQRPLGGRPPVDPV